MSSPPDSTPDFSAKPFCNPTSFALSPFSYTTYPHCNGFTRDADVMVVGRFENGLTSLWKADLRRGKETEIGRFPVEEVDPRWDFAYFDVSPQSNRLVARCNNALWLIELDKIGESQQFDESQVLYRAPRGAIFHDLPSISAAGDRVLIAQEEGKIYSCVAVETATGKATTLFSKPWYANHFHFCPHDENWTGFSHEGPASQISDRMWLWHARKAPQGRPVFDQKSALYGAPLAIGHERWAFHDLSAVVVAYGESETGPRGLYEVFGDYREPRLVSEGDRDWHCNLSRDGKLAVVDTTGDSDFPGKGWENAGLRSDIILIDLETGKRQLLYRARENGQGYQGRTSHPFQPHPTFNPTGDLVIFNDYLNRNEKVVPGVRCVHV